MLIGFLLIVIAGGVFGVLYYLDRTDYQKWNEELEVALSLPDGEFETKMREILSSCDRRDILEQVVFELGESKDEGAVSLLLDKVSMGGTVGREAAKALAKIGSDEAKKTAPDPIVEQMALAKEKEQLFDHAIYAWALCSLGDDRGFGPLLEAVANRVITTKSLPEFDPDVIVRLGTTERLLQMSESPDPMLRMYASVELGFRENPQVVPALLKLVKDDNLDVAEAAAISLGRTTDERAGPALLETMETKPSLRDSILSAIAQSVGAPGLEIIYENVKAADQKYKIIGKLKKLRDPRSKDLLLSILDEKFPGSDENAIKQGDEIRNQALWTLEDLGDPRIAPMMFEKTQWEPVSEEAIPDPAVRYRQDDMSRKIANGVVTWFGKVQPEGVADFLMKIYEANAPYSNTPECAQRVKVDVGPLMDAMGRTGDQRFCKIIEPLLDRDEGFYFQAASMALARLDCKGVLKDFVKRMKMTREERKEERFSSLLESRDWQMENRLQERRNSIIAARFLGSPKAGEVLMDIVLDPDDDQELRREAAASLAYCADEKLMEQIVEKVRDSEIDIVARAALVQGLWFKPTQAATDAMLDILEGTDNFELVKPAAIAVGEAANPANEERLNKLLDHADEHRQRAAVLAILLGGSMERIDKILELLDGQENKLVIREWYESHPVYLSRSMFDSKSVYKRLINARALSDKTAGGTEEILWPWKHLMQRLKSGWDEGPGGLAPLEIREELAKTVREDAEYRELAASILSGLNERGYLLVLQGEDGPQADVARDMIKLMNSKTQ